MEQAVKIKLDTGQENAQNFGFLRGQGLAVIQQLASGTWTDHNLHDPGITLLEALCYALTEGGLRNSMELRDLLRSSEVFAPQEFFTAAEVLPMSPLSSRDLQKVLIDHPLVNRAWVYPLEGEPLGRISVLLEFEQTDLNANTLSGTVTVAATDYQVDIAFPHWDDPEVAALQADVTLQGVSFDPPLPNPWQPVEGSDAWFARIVVDYTPQGGGAQQFEAWVVLQVTSKIADPIADLPGILTAAATFLQTLGDNSPADQSLLKQYNRRVTQAFETSRIVRRYIKNYRNLCESFADFRAVQIQEVAFTANIEVSGGVDVESLLANIFTAVDAYISPEIKPDTLDALVATGVDPTAIFDGPLTRYGLIGDAKLGADLPLNKLYSSDIVRLIMQLRRPDGGDIQTRETLDNRSIVSVRNVSLSLFLDNRSITTGAKDCLQLINSTRHIPRLSPEKCSVTFNRNSVEVPVDLGRVIALFEQNKSAASAPPDPVSPDFPIPEGVAYPTGDYYPVQNDLPLVYGVGAAGLPDTASDSRKAQARQLKAYLFFYEQVLAGYFAQLAHVNDFFSANPALTTTLFQQTLYHLPAVQDLLRAFDAANDNWDLFTADATNPYRRILDGAVQSEDQFLEQRHKVLDHLMARLGDGMKEYSDLVYRQTFTVPNAGTLTLPELLAAQQQRRRQAAHQLIADKSGFYYALPAMQRDRAQAFGLPDWRLESAVLVQATPAGFNWTIRSADGQDQLRQALAANTETEARWTAEAVLSLATQAGNYAIVLEAPGQRRVVLRPSASASPLALSINTFPTIALAQNAAAAIRQSLLQLWLEFTLSGLESRLYHQLGFLIKNQRRQLVHPVDDYFEIYEEVDADPFIEKRFRLYAQPGHSGTILMESENHYPGPDDPTTIALARAAIDEAIKTGISLENYAYDTLAPGVISVTLLDSSAAVIGRTPGNFATQDAATAAAMQIRDLLYRFYSAEGFYIAEHLLLNPLSTTDVPLQIEDAENPCQPVYIQRKDPYSFQISFVFPSGYMRDFSGGDTPSLPCQPDRFRDPEFRQYAELKIRQLCPAHILPMVLWADRSTPGTAIAANAPCFDLFETKYRNWLSAFLSDETPDSILTPLRNALNLTLNAIYQEALLP